MRIIFIFFLLISMNVQATKYYVANAGSDASNGLTTGTAWQHISKVNSTATIGDSVLFNSGDSWNEKLIPAANNIYYGSYGTGIKPTITGLQTVSGWVNITGNIWRTIASNSVDSLQTVILNGKMAIKGRYPNMGYLTFTSYSGATQITGSLTGTPSYAGKEIVVRTCHWVIDVTKVSSQSGGVLNISPALTYAPQYDGNGYFFQNDSSFVDTLNEYSYNKATKALVVYSVGSPNVQIATIDTLVWLRKKNNITFDGLNLTGANRAAFQIDTSASITIKNCSINYSGTLGISAAKSAYVTIDKDSIQNTLSGAIYMRRVDPYTPMLDTCNYAVVTNNYIKNTGIYAGMGMSNNERYFAIHVVGSHLNIKYNRIDSTGYDALDFKGDSSLVYGNWITNFCFIKDDGAGISTGVGGYFPMGYTVGSIIRHNMVFKGIGAPAGCALLGYSDLACGIYLDDYSNHILVDSNTVDSCNYASFFIHSGTYNTVKYNTFLDTAFGRAVEVESDVSITNNLTFIGNIYYQKSITQDLVHYTNTGITPQTIDSNYYLRPTAPSNMIHIASSFYSFPGWQSATGYDTNGGTTPTGVYGGNYIFWYNPTKYDSVFTIPATYVDVKGNYYYGYSSENKVILKPFTSLILFKTVGEVYSGTIYGNQNKIR